MVVRRSSVRLRPASSNNAVRKASSVSKLAREACVIRRSLSFGCLRKPSALVVVFHGLNDSAKTCSEPFAKSWIEKLPGVLLVVAESPDQTSWSSIDDPGYTWFEPKLTERENWHPFPPHARDEKSIRKWHRAVSIRCGEINKWLDTLLAKHNLTDRNLVLAGMSQGSHLAAILGARRGVRGVIVCGGVPYPRTFRMRDMMPQQSRSRFCVINGTLDVSVERRAQEAMLRPYDCEWHWTKHGHDFPDAWYAHALKWLRKLLQDD